MDEGLLLVAGFLLGVGVVGWLFARDRTVRRRDRFQRSHGQWNRKR